MIKDGVLLSTASSASTSTPPANADSSEWPSIRPLRPTHDVYVYYTALSPTGTSRQPVHRNGDGGAGQRVQLLNLNTLSARPPTMARVALWTRRACTCRRRQCERRQPRRVSPLCSERSCASIGTGRFRRPIVLHEHIWHQSRDLGAWLRIPTRSRSNPGSSSMFINDGWSIRREEIDDGVAGANYGWRIPRGPFRSTIPRAALAYRHSGGALTGCAITGGTFYSPDSTTFPHPIAAITSSPTTARVDRNARSGEWQCSIGFSPRRGGDAIVDLRVDSGARSTTRARRWQHGAGASTSSPTTTHRLDHHAPGQCLGGSGRHGDLHRRAVRSGPLSYHGRRTPRDPRCDSRDLHDTPVQQSDNGASFRVAVSNEFGSITSIAAIHGVEQRRSRHRPSPTVLPARCIPAAPRSPSQNRYRSGGWNAAAECVLVARGLHHDSHLHPFLAVSRAERDVDDPDHRRDGVECVVPRPPRCRDSSGQVDTRSAMCFPRRR